MSPNDASVRRKQEVLLSTVDTVAESPAAFSDFGLSPEMLRALAEVEYAIPSPVQVEAIPALMAGSDVP